MSRTAQSILHASQRRKEEEKIKKKKKKLRNSQVVFLYSEGNRFSTNVSANKTVQVEFIDWIMLENTWKSSETEIYSLD